ncbi:MAG: site-specific DNA-methyltransferase [Prevotella sp.]|nr:site-specific DNA-methyltransferase [Candidatus Prevotella equi]
MEIKNDNIYLGDTRNLIKELADESVDLVVSDVPYLCVSGGDAKGIWRDKMCGGMLAKHGRDNRESDYDNVKKGKLFDHNDIKFSEWMSEVWRVLKMDSHCYIMVNGRNLKDLWEEAERSGFMYQQLLVWDKGNATPNRYYMNGCEFILMLRKGMATNVNDMGMSNLLSVPNVVANKLHPTGKPVELMEILIRQSSDPDDVVLDPFAGSGSTLLAAKRLCRHYIGFEIDQKYYDIAAKRLTEKTEVSLFDNF